MSVGSGDSPRELGGDVTGVASPELQTPASEDGEVLGESGLISRSGVIMLIDSVRVAITKAVSTQLCKKSERFLETSRELCWPPNGKCDITKGDCIKEKLYWMGAGRSSSVGISEPDAIAICSVPDTCACPPDTNSDAQLNTRSCCPRQPPCRPVEKLAWLSQALSIAICNPQVPV